MSDLRRRALRVALPALLAAVAVAWMWAPSSRPAPAAPSQRARAAAPPTTLPQPGSPTLVQSSEPDALAAFEAEASAVHDHCDLGLTTACVDGACVAMATAPDLDRPGGWVAMVARSPRFVLSTALRDLGVPTTTLPCGSAIDGLVRDGEVRMFELADGGEVWCMVRGDRSRGDALCDELAAATVGLSAARFDDPTLRRLEFDRSER